MKRSNLIIWIAIIALLVAINLGYLLGNNLVFMVGIAIAALGFIAYAFVKIVDAMGINLFISVVLGLAIIGVATYGLAKFHKRFDLTKEKVFSLAPQTVKVLKNLNTKVEVIGIAEERSDARQRMEELFKLYREVNPRFFYYRIIDPYKSPEAISELGKVALGTVIVKVGKRKDRVDDLTEENLTNSIIKLTSKGGKKVYFLKGHGEISMEVYGKTGISSAATRLRDLGYDVGEISLAEGAVPEDVRVVVIPGPKTDFLEVEIKRLDRFLRKGGSVIAMVDPTEKPLTNLYKFLRKYGISLKNGIVVDMVSQIFGVNALVPVVTNYKWHDITRNFRLMTFYPLAQGVFLADPLPEGVSGLEIAETSEKSWEEFNLKPPLKFDQGKDIPGPIPLAVALEVKGIEKDKKGRLVVFGDSDFITNAYYDQQGNGNLFENSVNWCSKEENLIAISPRNFKSSTLILTGKQQRFIGFLSIILIPEIFLLIGLWIWMRRRWQ